MSIRLAVSSACCPDLEVGELIQKAKCWGYQGVELAGPHGHSDLGPAGRCLADPEVLSASLAESGLLIAALSLGLSLPHPGRHAPAQLAKSFDEHFRRAAQVGSPCVVVRGGPSPAGWKRARVLERTAGVLRALADRAAARRLVVAFENSGNLASSRDAWFLRDAAGHSGVRVCLNPLNALAAGETLSLAVPRLGGALAMVRVSDACLDRAGRITRHTPLGEGDLNLPRLIELLKGVAYRGWLCVHWPSVALESLGSPEAILPAACEFLRAELEKSAVILTAYKGDSNAPRFADAKI